MQEILQQNIETHSKKASVIGRFFSRAVHPYDEFKKIIEMLDHRESVTCDDGYVFETSEPDASIR